MNDYKLFDYKYVITNVNREAPKSPIKEVTIWEINWKIKDLDYYNETILMNPKEISKQHVIDLINSNSLINGKDRITTINLEKAKINQNEDNSILVKIDLSYCPEVIKTDDEKNITTTQDKTKINNLSQLPYINNLFINRK